jgi:hypothetical protein
MGPRDSREDPPEVDFVIGPSGDGPDDELLETGTPHRADRRLMAGVIVAALIVVAGVVAVLRAGDSSDRIAKPANSSLATGLSAAPLPPAYPSTRPSFSPRSGRPDACPQDWVCTPAPTSAKVRRMVERAVVDAFGAASDVRVTTRLKHLRDHRYPGLLFTRLVTSDTPVGPVAVYVYTSITGARAEYFPHTGPGELVSAAAGVGGYDVSVAVRVVHRMGSTNARMTRLTRDERLIATQ